MELIGSPALCIADIAFIELASADKERIPAHNNTLLLHSEITNASLSNLARAGRLSLAA